MVGGTPRIVNDRIVLDGAVPAPLLYASRTQINLQIPPQIPPGPVFFQLLVQGKLLRTALASLSSVSPAIFTFATGQGAVLNQDNSINGPGTGSAVHPAPRGSVIQIFGTGAGATNPPLAAGEAAPGSGSPLVLTVAQPTVTIGGKTARVLFSGLAPGFVGLWQINAEVPQDVTPGSSVPLQVAVGTVASNTATIAVQ